MRPIYRECGPIRRSELASCVSPTPSAAVRSRPRSSLRPVAPFHETAPQVEETIEAAIERPLMEWGRRMKQAQNAEWDRILDKWVAFAVPLAEAAGPWVKAIVLTKVCEIFGLKPAPQPSS